MLPFKQSLPIVVDFILWSSDSISGDFVTFCGPGLPAYDDNGRKQSQIDVKTIALNLPHKTVIARLIKINNRPVLVLKWGFSSWVLLWPSFCFTDSDKLFDESMDFGVELDEDDEVRVRTFAGAKIIGSSVLLPKSKHGRFLLIPFLSLTLFACKNDRKYIYIYIYIYI